jgi:hemolysin activation/secretion protein
LTTHPQAQRLRLFLFALALTGLSANGALAQPTANEIIHGIAGDVMRNMGNLERNRQQRDAMSQQEIYPPEWRIDPNDQTEWLLMGFEIRGNHLVRADAILDALKPYLRKRITLNQSTDVLALVEQVYKDAGVEAKIYLPKQSIQRPKMLIQVIERPTSMKP